MGLPPIIKELLDPQAYPERPDHVELRQTHISYVFLTPKFAYKIKKPVDFGFLDFTTVEKRRHFCHEEVRLNRRLAPKIYLGVVPVALKDGKPVMGGEGEAVEYAVKMARVPDSTLLLEKLRNNEAGPVEIKRVGHVIAGFHGRAETSDYIKGFGSPRLIRKNTDENFAQTFPYIGKTVSEGLYKKIKSYTENFIRENETLFSERMAGGFVRDCHGDIHSEHVSIVNGIDIIDCIEFNERFRFSDVVSDLAFLSMDLDCLNRNDLTRVLEDSYFIESGDEQGRGLLDFYKCYRAYVRGKVEGFKSAEPEVAEAERADSILSALYHFHLSGLYASGGFRPQAVIIRGLQATGKSTLSRALSEHTGYSHLSTDSIRKELAGLQPGERRVEKYKEGIYSADFTERVYAALIKRALEFLSAGRSVVLDATFSKKRLFDLALETFKGFNVHLIECVAKDSTVRERMERRPLEPVKGAVSDADWAIYQRQKAEYDPIKAGLTLKAEVAPVQNLLETARKIFD